MMNRRNLLLSAALLTLTMAAPALAADDLKLPRQHVDLVAPPFVHPHEQATKSGPKIIEFTLNIEEKKVVIDEQGTTFQAMTFNGSMPGPLMVVHEGDYVEVTLVNPATNSMPHNIDFHSATGALGGARAHAGQPGRAGHDPLEGHPHRHVRLSLRTGRPDDPLARRLRNERRRDGAAARRPDRRQGQAAALRQGCLHRRAGHVRAEGREAANTSPTTLRAKPIPTPSR